MSGSDGGTFRRVRVAHHVIARAGMLHSARRRGAFGLPRGRGDVRGCRFTEVVSL